jgi:hypothetical protein
MDVSNIDLAVFKYKPFSEETYQTLKNWPEFKKVNNGAFDIGKFIDYVILAFDFNSPLRKEFPFIEKEKTYNLQRIKFEAAKLAGFTLKEKAFVPKVQEFLLGQNQDVNTAVVKYLISFGRMEYVVLVSYEAMLLSLVRQSFMDAGEKDTIDKRIKSHMDNINELTIKLYGGQETIEAKEALYLSAEKDIANYFPEGVAEIMEKNGKLPEDWSPYHGKASKEVTQKEQNFKSKFLGKQKPKK